MLLHDLRCCAQGFDCAELLYSDYSQLPAEVEEKLGAKYSSLEDLVKYASSLFTSKMHSNAVPEGIAHSQELFGSDNHTCCCANDSQGVLWQQQREHLTL